MQGRQTIRRAPSARQAAPTWLSVSAAARRLRLPFGAVLAAIRHGELPARLVAGSRWFIDAADVASYQQRLRGAK
jgi:excisionase family DNA binding protein